MLGRSLDFSKAWHGLDLDKEGDFVVGSVMRNGTRFFVNFYYVKDGDMRNYVAEGEDEIDLHRDWAYEYISLFSKD